VWPFVACPLAVFAISQASIALYIVLFLPVVIVIFACFVRGAAAH
jgi:hypothetical protein